MNYSEQVKADAKAAADYIREHGWCQFMHSDEKGAVCMNGAIEAVRGPLNFYAMEDELYNACRAIVGLPEGALGTSFNDRPGRTKEEVIAVFEKIANSPSA